MCASLDCVHPIELWIALSSLKWLFKDLTGKCGCGWVYPSDFALSEKLHHYCQNKNCNRTIYRVFQDSPKDCARSYLSSKTQLLSNGSLGKSHHFCSYTRTAKSMLPCICRALTNMLRSLIGKFIKPSVIEKPGTQMDVTKLRVVDVVEEHMKKNSKAEKQRMGFRQNCKLFSHLKIFIQAFWNASP